MEKGKAKRHFQIGCRVALLLLVGLFCIRLCCMAMVAEKIKPVIAEIRENTVGIERQGIFNFGKLDLNEEEFNRFLTKLEHILVLHALPFTWGQRCDSADAWITFHYSHGSNGFVFWGADVRFRNGSGELDLVGLTEIGFQRVMSLLERYRTD